MTLNKAIQILNEVIPPPTHATVDLDHLPISQAWEFVKRHTQPINKGSWVKQELAPQTLRFCSLCGYQKPRGVAGNFCPNCGADMRGVKDER